MRTMWTIGHWTRSQPDFLALLAAQDIEMVADVRAHPGSRNSPQFGRDVMPGWLREAGLDYVHLDELGGRRRKQPNAGELNAGWQNASFRNYADYTLSAAFTEGLERLEALATERRSVLMCAESTPWRCHRLLLANALTARGWTVRHIISAADPVDHRLGQWGAAPRPDDAGRVTYPG